MNEPAPRFAEHQRVLVEANALRAWGWSNVNSWYKNANGRSPIMWPLSTAEFWAGTKPPVRSTTSSSHRTCWAAVPGHYASMVAPHTPVPHALRRERPVSSYPADLKGTGVPTLSSIAVKR
jgi:hypothetical protein